jgi:aminoglycoside phosphotransferase
MSAVPGPNLAVLAKRLSQRKIVEMLASALQAFHSVDTSDCPFNSYMRGESLVHGDACLPNIIGRDDGMVNGYTDLGEMGVGDVEPDLSAAVWSLQRPLMDSAAASRRPARPLAGHTACRARASHVLS